MRVENFLEQARRASTKLEGIQSRIFRTVDVLQRLLKTKEVEISEWAIRSGSVFITFTSPVEIIEVPESEQHIKLALEALFPSCRTSGTLIEIESSELL